MVSQINYNEERGWYTHT